MRLLLFLLLNASVVITTESANFVVTASSSKNGPAHSGDNVTLNCSVVIGGPVDSISWYKTDEDIPIPTKPVEWPSNTSLQWSSILLVNVTLRDAVKYRCLARKGNQKDNDAYKLEVYAKPEIQLPEVWIVSPLRTRSIDCIATGSPTPEITWYFNGKVLRDEDKKHSIIITTESREETKSVSTLQIISIEKKLHYGNYTCKGKNKVGSERRTFSLLVTAEPEVIAGDTQVVREGTNATLTCEGRKLLKENTEVKTSWTFEKKEILHDNARYKGSRRRASDAVRLELTVLNASANEAGQYTCKVRNNPTFFREGKVKLVVVSTGVRPTVKIRGPSQRAVKLGSNVTLQCDISYPAYLKTAHMFWLNETVQRRVANRTLPSDNTAIKTFALYLNITNINRQDLGFYICGVNTSIGIYDTQLELRLHRDNAQTDQQEGSNNTLPVIAVLVAGGVLFGLAGAFIARHLWQKRKTPLIDLYGSVNNRDFKYDVFITFSGKDFGWVKAKLLPLLEKHGIQYCIHNRDFELGRAILDNMADSVYTSKKVLAVMSKNYMASKYCRGELEMALYRSTEMGDSSLIVIRIDNIAKDKLPKSLRNRTFLDYYDVTERKTWGQRIIKHLIKTHIFV